MRPDITVAQVEALYWGEGLTLPQIASMLSCSRQLLRRRLLKDGGIRPRRRLENVTTEGVEELYWDKTQTMAQIAQSLGCSEATIRSRLLRGKGTRSTHETRALRENHGLTTDGYTKVKCPKHLRADLNGYVLGHILVYEENFGPIPEGYIVHHLNGIRNDNRPENLAALPWKRHRELGNTRLKAAQQRIQELEKELQRYRSKDLNG